MRFCRRWQGDFCSFQNEKNSDMPTGAICVAKQRVYASRHTYVILSLFDFRFFRGDSCRYGYGGRYGDDSSFDARRGRGTKDCAVRKPLFLFAHERFCLKDSCQKRTFTNAGDRLDDFACLGNVCDFLSRGGGFAFRDFAKGVRGFSDCTCLLWF